MNPSKTRLQNSFLFFLFWKLQTTKISRWVTDVVGVLCNIKGRVTAKTTVYIYELECGIGIDRVEQFVRRVACRSRRSQRNKEHDGTRGSAWRMLRSLCDATWIYWWELLPCFGKTLGWAKLTSAIYLLQTLWSPNLSVISTYIIHV